jgi:hypothetical protein
MTEGNKRGRKRLIMRWYDGRQQKRKEKIDYEMV